VHYVFNPDHYIGIVIANTKLLYKYQSSKLAMLLLYVYIIIFTSSSQSSRLQSSTTEIIYNEADTDGHGGRNRIVVRPTYVISLTPIHGIWGCEPDATLLHEVTCGRSVVF
jgi:hypothetical protein